MPESPALATLKIMLQEVASGQTSIGDVLAALDDNLGKQLASLACAYCGEEADGPMLPMGSNTAHLECAEKKLAELTDQNTFLQVSRDCCSSMQGKAHELTCKMYFLSPFRDIP